MKEVRLRCSRLVSDWTVSGPLGFQYKHKNICFVFAKITNYLQLNKLTLKMVIQIIQTCDFLKLCLWCKGRVLLSLLIHPVKLEIVLFLTLASGEMHLLRNILYLI